MVSVWRPGFPVLRLFVVYIARAPSNYCADATPTRGVWSQIHSHCHNLSRLYRLPDRSPCNVYTVTKRTRGLRLTPSSMSLFAVKIFTHRPLYCTYRHVTAPPDRPRAPNSGDGHFQTRVSLFLCYRYVPTQCGSEERSESRARVRSELAYTP